MDAFRHTKTGVNSESKQSKKAMGGSVVVGVVCGRRGLRSLVSFVAVVRWFAAVDRRRRRRRRRRWWSLVVVFVGDIRLSFSFGWFRWRKKDTGSNQVTNSRP